MLELQPSVTVAESWDELAALAAVASMDREELLALKLAAAAACLAMEGAEVVPALAELRSESEMDLELGSAAVVADPDQLGCLAAGLAQATPYFCSTAGCERADDMP